MQVYFQPAEADHSVRLVGWQSVTVDPGATATVVVSPDAPMWRRRDEASGGWQQLAAGGRLLVAGGLGDVRATIELP